MASTKAAYSGSFRAAERKSSVSSSDQGDSSRAATVGGSTSVATFRVTSSSRQAAVRAVRRTRCDSLAVAALVFFSSWTRKRRTSATLRDSSRLEPSIGTR
ncbi:hypothetical protein GCM10020367_19950 [Streptomyces sannanensis]|uniref:Uncharacterized protein n=1 Tax=Streptomyces sannanensis TaxID=285536 RepID=A0ABP6S933_9ACTN